MGQCIRVTAKIDDVCVPYLTMVRRSVGANVTQSTHVEMAEVHNAHVIELSCSRSVRDLLK